MIKTCQYKLLVNLPTLKVEYIFSIYILILLWFLFERLLFSSSYKSPSFNTINAQQCLTIYTHGNVELRYYVEEKKLRKHATNLTIKITVYTMTCLVIKPKLISKKKVRQELIIISSFVMKALPIQVQKKTIAQNRSSTMRPNSLQLTKMFSAQILHDLR